MFRRDFFRTLLGGALALAGIGRRRAMLDEAARQIRSAKIGCDVTLDKWGLPTTYMGYPIIVEGRLPPPG